MLSFVAAAICCGLAALCYAEFASSIPISGSAYTFSYASLGEIVAWIIGWDLLLELMLGASVVAQGWSAYLGVFLDHLGVAIPESVAYGSRFDLPAFVLVVVLSVLVSIGIKESLRVNLVLVALKVFIVLFVIVAGIGFIKSANYSPFIPPTQPAEAQSSLESPLIEWAFGFAPSHFGVARHPRRRVAGVLRLHRLRRRGDDGRGGQEPQARPADRHHRLAGDLHGALLRRGDRPHRHGAVRPALHRGLPGHGVRDRRQVRLRAPSSPPAPWPASRRWS